MSSKADIKQRESWKQWWSADERYSPALKEFLLEGERKSNRWSHINDRIRKHFGNKSNLKVLEIGGGNVRFSYLMIELFKADVTICDYIQKATAIAARFLDEYAKKANIYWCDITNISDQVKCNESFKFDIVYSDGVIEHYKNDKKILDAHFDNLKSGGIVIISVPNTLCFPYLIYRIIAKIFGRFKVGREHSYTFWKLRRKIRKYGFRDISISGSRYYTNRSDVFMFLIRPCSKLLHMIFGFYYSFDEKKSKQIMVKERPGFWRQLFSYDITLIARK